MHGRWSSPSGASPRRNRHGVGGRLRQHREVSAPTARPADAVPDPNLVTALLREQVPELADLPVRASETQGSSNWVQDPERGNDIMHIIGGGRISTDATPPVPDRHQSCAFESTTASSSARHAARSRPSPDAAMVVSSSTATADAQWTAS